jgi:hypothetical protein
MDERPAHISQICSRAHVNTCKKSLQQTGFVLNREELITAFVIFILVAAIFCDGSEYERYSD